MLPDLFAVEAVAHVVAGLDDELLALVPLGVGELRVVVAEREAAEGDVPRLVLHDVGVDRGGERIRRRVADALEGGEREPLDQHLHAEIGHVPARSVMSSRAALERRRDRVGELELLVEQPRVGLDVARLVHHLGRRVELRVDGRGRSGRSWRCRCSAPCSPCMNCERCARPLEMAAQVRLLLGVELVPQRRAVDADRRSSSPAGSPGRGPATSRSGRRRPIAAVLPLP